MYKAHMNIDSFYKLLWQKIAMKFIKNLEHYQRALQKYHKFGFLAIISSQVFIFTNEGTMPVKYW